MRFCTLHAYRPHEGAVGHVILIVEEWAKRLQTIIPMYTQAHFFLRIIQLFFALLSRSGSAGEARPESSGEGKGKENIQKHLVN